LVPPSPICSVPAEILVSPAYVLAPASVSVAGAELGESSGAGDSLANAGCRYRCRWRRRRGRDLDRDRDEIDGARAGKIERAAEFQGAAIERQSAARAAETSVRAGDEDTSKKLRAAGISVGSVRTNVPGPLLITDFPIPDSTPLTVTTPVPRCENQQVVAQIKICWRA